MKMPILTFKCECGAVFEELCKFTEHHPCKCGRQARLIMSATNMKLKGHGFYKTDYKELFPTIGRK